MRKVKFGLIAGLIFGLIDVLLMLSLSFPDKSVAMTGAFVNRFAIGFLIPNVTLPLPRWLQAVIIAFLLSLPDAIITKSYGPIIGTGILGGLIIGILTHKFD